ncbi:MAG: flagellar basal body-associated FliL family protein [Planctomycetaceae bacterium]|nr:flagellar basal body-associated FliL family protein [Planctomycetaceae bacterium]
MAKTEETESKETPPKEPAAKRSSGLLYWILLAAVIAAGGTGGFALSQLIGGEDPNSGLSPQQAENKKDAENAMLATEQGQASWTQELEPVLANLDEPGVTRYVRVTVSLEMSPDMDPVKGKEFLDAKQMVLRDWMTTYFAGLSLEDCRGTRNLSRIKKEVVENFNKILFPNSRSFVQNVLFKEFAVQ